MNLNSKFTLTAGILNTILGAIMLIYAVLLALMAFVSLLLIITPLIIAALPMFFLFGFFAIVTLVAAVASEVTGIGSIMTSSKGGTPSRIFSVISVVVDAVMIPSGLATFAYNIFGLTKETESPVMWIALLISSALTVAMAIACLILNGKALKQANATEKTDALA